MSRRADITGQQFGRLMAIECVGTYKNNGNALWRCVCAHDGNELIVQSQDLRTGHTLSCGCVQRERAAQVSLTHGQTAPRTKEYIAWFNMKGRCSNPNSSGYDNYGGRGIQVCPEWLDSFEAFYAHIGPAPSKQHSVGRIDNDGHYEPGNVRWETWEQQAANKRPHRKRAV